MTEVTEHRGEWFFDNEPDPAQPSACPMSESPVHDRAACLRCEQQRRWVRATAARLEAAANEDEGAWEFVQLSEAPDLPPASLLELGAGTGDYLLRPGDVVNVHGEKGAGKTPLAYLLVVQEVRRGNLALIVDYEMGQPRARALLVELGLTLAQIDEGVCYVNNTPELTSAYRTKVLKAIGVREEQTGRVLTVAVIDSLTKSMTRLPNVSDNNAQDVATWYGNLPHWLRDETGAAVVVIDHSARADGPHPAGSHKKGEEPDFHVWLRKGPSFSRAKPERGYSSLVVVKDRSGERELDVDAAYLRTTGEGGTFTVEPVSAPAEGEVEVPLDRVPERSTDEEVLADLRTVRTDGIMRSKLTGTGDSGVYRRPALDRLLDEGLAVSRRSGRAQWCYAAEFAPE